MVNFKVFILIQKFFGANAAVNFGKLNEHFVDRRVVRIIYNKDIMYLLGKPLFGAALGARHKEIPYSEIAERSARNRIGYAGKRVNFFFVFVFGCVVHRRSGHRNNLAYLYGFNFFNEIFKLNAAYNFVNAVNRAIHGVRNYLLAATCFKAVHGVENNSHPVDYNAGFHVVGNGRFFQSAFGREYTAYYTAKRIELRIDFGKSFVKPAHARNPFTHFRGEFGNRNNGSGKSFFEFVFERVVHHFGNRNVHKFGGGRSRVVFPHVFLGFFVVNVFFLALVQKVVGKRNEIAEFNVVEYGVKVELRIVVFYSVYYLVNAHIQKRAYAGGQNFAYVAGGDYVVAGSFVFGNAGDSHEYIAEFKLGDNRLDDSRSGNLAVV